MKYRCLLIDPPWQETILGKFNSTRHSRPNKLPYPTLSIDQIRTLPVADLADENCHLWLWVTNRSIQDGFDLMKSWGFKYMNMITWVKPSGFGAWWINRTQAILFGYKGKLNMKERLKPNVIFANPTRHSEKPEASYDLIEAVSHGTRLELFARSKRPGWDVWGNEVSSDVSICL